MENDFFVTLLNCLNAIPQNQRPIGLMEFVKLFKALRDVTCAYSNELNHANIERLMNCHDVVATANFPTRPQLNECMSRSILMPIALRVVTGCRVVPNEFCTGLPYGFKTDVELKHFAKSPSGQALVSRFESVRDNGQERLFSATAVHYGIFRFWPTPHFFRVNFNRFLADQIVDVPAIQQHHMILAAQFQIASQMLANHNANHLSLAFAILDRIRQPHPNYYYGFNAILNVNVWRLIKYLLRNKLY